MEWVVEALDRAAYALRVLLRGVERGVENLAIDRSAWDNTMAAFEWALGEQLHGRVWSPQLVTQQDLDRVRRLHDLGAEALSGGERSPELRSLVEHCLELACGLGWAESDLFRVLA